MAQGKYISGKTQDTIIVPRETLEDMSVLDLGESSTLDLEKWKPYVYMDDDDHHDDHYDDHHDDGGGQTQYSLCSHIVLKNTITVIDSSIVTCIGINPTTCAITCTDEGIIAPNTYMNMMAIVNLVGIAQTGVVIQFHYLINNIPVTDPLLTNVTVNLIPGNNYVYLFPTNHIYTPNTMITFYGALVTSQ
jgi:hypothetical protein